MSDPDIDALADAALDSAEMLHMLAQESSHPIAEVDGAYTDLLAALNSLVATAKGWQMKDRAWQTKDRAMTDYFADASRRADEAANRQRELEAALGEADGERSLATVRAERAERERAELIRNGLTDETDTDRKLEQAERERDEAREDLRLLSCSDDEYGLAMMASSSMGRDREQNRKHESCVGYRLRAEAAEARVAELEATVRSLRAEVNCRIEHGAKDGGHLWYVQNRLDLILASPDPKEGTA